MTETTHQHVKSAPPFGCMITKDEAAVLAERSTRTIELWAEQGLITKFTVGPSGYWVRFCQEEIKAAQEPVVAGTPSASGSG